MNNSFVCFVAGTQVLVKGDEEQPSYRNIEEIQAGDQVWARSDQTGEENWKQVVRTFRNQSEQLVHLSYKKRGRSQSHRPASKSLAASDDEEEPYTLSGTPEKPNVAR